MKPIKRPKRSRELTTLDMLVTRKGGPMKDRRLKRTTRKSRKASHISEYI